ncbi:MAG: ferritin-like domain-containing protein [Proteobacteria bacterium]|nr:ferritin-like domain-containing protein [Pseudomonadota bacterium]
MRRFIQHTELARDSRFMRQNSLNAIFTSLPNDVDQVVEMFERFDPIIAQFVKGTPFEDIYEQYGPGFNLILLNERLRPDETFVELKLNARMHGIFAGELQALEGAGRTLWDFPEAPWDFKMNMARQCWDESRHVQIFEKLLAHVGGEVGQFPESTFLFEAACADDPVLRVAGVNRGLEGLACDIFRDMIEFAKLKGDKLMEQAIDYVLADELTHVRFGSEWVREFTKDDPKRAKAAKDFQREVDRQFSIGGARSAAEDAAIPIAVEERKEAGFTDQEIEELAEVSTSGPTRQTLRDAAEILRVRHQARKQQKEAKEATA